MVRFCVELAKLAQFREALPTDCKIIRTRLRKGYLPAPSWDGHPNRIQVIDVDVNVPHETGIFLATGPTHQLSCQCRDCSMAERLLNLPGVRAFYLHQKKRSWLERMILEVIWFTARSGTFLNYL